MLEGAFRAHLYTEAETNKKTDSLDPAVIARNADKVQLWYNRALTSNLKTDDVDNPTEQSYDQFPPLKKKYVGMADDYVFGILIEVFKAQTVSMLLESKRREALKGMQSFS